MYNISHIKICLIFTEDKISTVFVNSTISILHIILSKQMINFDMDKLTVPFFGLDANVFIMQDSLKKIQHSYYIMAVYYCQVV